MDISNIKRSVLIILVTAVVLLFIILSITALMLKRNEVGFQSPVIVRKNPEVTYAFGEALYMKKGGAEWKDIEIGITFKEGGSIKTGADGIADFRFSDGTAMRVTNNSFLSLEDLSLTTIDVSLKKGGLVSKFTKLFSNQHFSVETPGAVAGIRGTELVFTVEGDTTSIVGMSGITEVYNPKYPDSRVLLGFQTKTHIRMDRPPKDPVKLTSEEVERYRNMLDSIHLNNVLVIGNPIQFKPDTAKMTTESKKELEKLAGKIRWHRFRIEIQGHTADVGDSSSQYSLSLKRAQTIRDYLVSLKINKKRLSVRGFGGSKPIASNDTPEGRARNRRVEFVIQR